MSAFYHYNVAVVMAFLCLICLAVDDAVWSGMFMLFSALNIWMGWKIENEDVSL